MSSDTAAQPPDATPQHTASPDPAPPSAAPEDAEDSGDPVDPRQAVPERPEPEPIVPRQQPSLRRPAPPGPRPRGDRHGRAWTVAVIAAAVLFCAALAFGATRLLAGGSAPDVTDTPERTVAAFLEALLDDRDADAAASWLCTDKADRDLSAAVDTLAEADGREPEWGDVTETARSVGAATVTAEVGMEGRATAATWEFTLVAEQGHPHWLICGIAAA